MALDTSVHGTFADISDNNSSVDVRRYTSAGHLLLSIKCTEGTSYTNPNWADWTRHAHWYRTCVLHYHFCRPENGDPEGEAAHFHDQVNGGVSVRYHDKLCLDIETGDESTWPDYIRRFEAKLEQLFGERMPYLVGYCSRSPMEALGGDFRLKSTAWWIAAYSMHEPPHDLPGGQTLWAWQYTDGSGYGPGPQRFAGIGQSDASFLNANTVENLRRELRR